MKQIHLLALFTFSFFSLTAQNTNETAWLHRSDMLVGNEVVRLSVKEVYLDEQLQYKFVLSLNGSTKEFYILSDDFVKGSYLEKLVLTKIQDSYNNLNMPASDTAANNALTTYIAAIVANTRSDSGKISMSDRSALQEILESLAKNHRQKNLEALFKDLRNAATVDESKAWLNEQLTAAKTQIATRREDAQKDLEENGKTFLNTALDVLARRSTEGPQVGTLYIKKQVEIRWYRYDEKPQKYKAVKESQLQVKEVEVKFEYGQLASITAKGYLKERGDTVFTFHNRIPISYSTKFDVSFDYHIIGSIRLYCKDRWLDGYYIRVDELLYNDYKMSNYTNNYSPIDTVLVLRPLEPGKVIFRERVMDVLQARIYTDFIGFDDNNPNGLVQVEISKRINLKTKIKKNSTPDPGSGESDDNKDKKVPKRSPIITHEWFRYIIPLASFTKIEQNNKYLDIALGLDSSSTVNAIDLIKYTNFKVGVQQNIIRRSTPEFHSNFTLDAGFHVLRTGISRSGETRDTATSAAGDTTFFQTSRTDLSHVLSLNFAPVIFSWNIYPHSHYYVSFFYKMQYIQELSSQLSIADKENGGKWVQQLGLFGGIRTGESGNGEIFARVTLDLQVNSWDYNYLQGQVGYSFKILSKKPQFKNRTIF